MTDAFTLIREYLDNDAIRECPSNALDFRTFRQTIPCEKWQQFEDMSDYELFKYTVADVIRPKSIVEIGVGWGIAANAFRTACPMATYTGYDSGADDEGIFDFFKQQFPDDGWQIRKADSGILTELPLCDLVHVDGAHDYGHACHDTLMALRAAPWVLVDDARDSQVAAAALMAAFVFQPGDIEWAYYEDTLTGNILFRRK